MQQLHVAERRFKALGRSIFPSVHSFGLQAASRTGHGIAASVLLSVRSGGAPTYISEDFGATGLGDRSFDFGKATYAGATGMWSWTPCASGPSALSGAPEVTICGGQAFGVTRTLPVAGMAVAAVIVNGNGAAMAAQPVIATFTNQSGHAANLGVSGTAASVTASLRTSPASVACSPQTLLYAAPSSDKPSAQLTDRSQITLTGCLDSLDAVVPVGKALKVISGVHTWVSFAHDAYNSVSHAQQQRSSAALEACATGRMLSYIASVVVPLGVPTCTPNVLPQWTGKVAAGQTLQFTVTPIVEEHFIGSGEGAAVLFSFIHMHVSEWPLGAPPIPDWRNASYTMTCGGAAAHPFTVTLKDGKAVAPASGNGPYSRFDVHLEAVTQPGNLTGPGSGETAVLLYCSPQPSNFYNEEVQIFRSNGTLLAELPQATTFKPANSPLPPLYDSSQFSIRAGQLVTGMNFYAPTDSHAGGPSIHEVVTWHWDGQQFLHSRISLPQEPACPKAASGVPPGLVSAVAPQVGNQCGLEIDNLKFDPQDPSWVLFSLSPTPGSLAQGGGGIAHEENGQWTFVETGSALFWCVPGVPARVVKDFGLSCPKS